MKIKYVSILSLFGLAAAVASSSAAFAHYSHFVACHMPGPDDLGIPAHFPVRPIPMNPPWKLSQNLPSWMQPAPTYPTPFEPLKVPLESSGAAAV